jgi:hypothetical protein
MVPTPEYVGGPDGVANAAAAATLIRADGPASRLEPMNDPHSTQNMRLGRFALSQLQHSTVGVDDGGLAVR